MLELEGVCSDSEEFIALETATEMGLSGAEDALEGAAASVVASESTEDASVKSITATLVGVTTSGAAGSGSGEASSRSEAVFLLRSRNHLGARLCAGASSVFSVVSMTATWGSSTEVSTGVRTSLSSSVDVSLSAVSGEPRRSRIPKPLLCLSCVSVSWG